MIRGIFFDVYGTLIHSNSSIYVSPYSHLMADQNLSEIQIAEVWSILMTNSLPSIRDAASIIENFSGVGVVSEVAINKAESDLVEHLESMVVMDGVHQVLSDLIEEGYLMVLVSNLCSPYKRPIRELGVENLVQECVYSCDVGYLKPDPKIFKLALEKINMAASQVIMVGDNEEDDIAGGVAAGIKGILIDPMSVSGMRSIRELPGVLRR